MSLQARLLAAPETGERSAYQTSFNPAAPLTNIVAANDDFPTTALSGFTSLNSNAGTQYFFVTTAFSNTGVGAYANRIGTVTRPTGSLVTLGTIGGTVAPEPGSFALAGRGALPLIGLVARRRKNRA